MPTDDYLKQQEEELRRKIELEAEERKLEETLEYQRRIEEEAKQKHLAEQFKNSTETSSCILVDETGAVGSNLNVCTVSKQDGLTSNSQSRLHSNGSPVCLKDIEFGDFHFSQVSMCKNYPNVELCNSKHESGRPDVLLNSDRHRFVGNEVTLPVQNINMINSAAGSKTNGIGKAAACGKSSTSSSVEKINKATSQSQLRNNQG